MCFNLSFSKIITVLFAIVSKLFSSELALIDVFAKISSINVIEL
jgi:hypothetical protein